VFRSICVGEISKLSSIWLNNRSAISIYSVYWKKLNKSHIYADFPLYETNSASFIYLLQWKKLSICYSFMIVFPDIMFRYGTELALCENEVEHRSHLWGFCLVWIKECCFKLFAWMRRSWTDPTCIWLSPCMNHSVPFLFTYFNESCWTSFMPIWFIPTMIVHM